MSKTPDNIYEMSPVQLLNYISGHAHAIGVNDKLQIIVGNAIERHQTIIKRANDLLRAIKENS